MRKNFELLFETYNLQGTPLKNRFVMAPMTRSRSEVPGNVPNKLMAEYYAQRAGAGLIVTEATQISLQGQGYAATPGIYTDKQVKGWMQVTNAVHRHEGRIYLQLWHVGRVSSSRVNGLQPIAPSTIEARDTKVYVFDDAPNGDATLIPVEAPREMSTYDIEELIREYVHAAHNALKAGFDGVEIHAANGYLLDQFLRSNSNHRTDDYGGSRDKRIRLLKEVVNAVCKVVGASKVGVRLSPFIKFKDMDDPEILDTIMTVARELNKLDIAYIHLCEADWDDAPVIPLDFRLELRKAFENTIVATGNKSPEEGESLLARGLVDLIGFGRKFLANPDYPERVRMAAPLNEITDRHTLFGGRTAKGYTDYPFYNR